MTMVETTLIAQVRKHEKEPETLVVASPHVGIVVGAPKVGTFLNPLDRIITLKVLNERYVVLLPRDVHGWITETFIPNNYASVEYGQSIVCIDPHLLEAGAEDSGGQAAVMGVAREADDAGLIAVKSPSNGIFYRCPSPDSPPCVEVGSPVTSGSPLGLVEIMKCYYQIDYGGQGLPETGEIVEILVEDASVVQFGQVLFWIKPIGKPTSH